MTSPSSDDPIDRDLLATVGQVPIDRIPVQDVAPAVDGGDRPTKSVVGELFTVSATVFREGHDAVNATVVLTDPDGAEHPVGMRCLNEGLNHWATPVFADREGRWSYRVEGWSDPYSTWRHNAQIKVEADVDVELMLEEGARLLERARDEVERSDDDTQHLSDSIAALRDDSRPKEARLAAGAGRATADVLTRDPLRDMVSPSREYVWWVERQRALNGAWYEIFPRSEGAEQDPKTGLWTSGTFATAADRLPAIAHMGFDVVYLTPVHPIGETNRKGPNNSLEAGEHDPGSPYAIGSADGGQDAIHPDLGDFDDFDAFVDRAREEGLEVALDIALSASPDHPWVEQYPELFTTQADGTIAYAENPPKKYQDIYPLNFDNDPKLAYSEMRRVMQVWLDHGIRIFRVDNPHTKPVEFWQWLIADIGQDYPDVIWLAEAFTKPAMMHTLAKVGFQQSYTYYAWRNTAADLREYLTELSGDAAAYMRPSFWPTTHDILTPYMQYGGPTAFKLRAALAATLVPTYGIYAGYEHCEHVARPGAEEQIDNEKYEYKNRRWDLDAGHGGTGEAQGRPNLGPYLKLLNEARKNHPCLHWLRNITFHSADDENVLVYSKTGGGAHDGSDTDTVIAVVNLDPHSMRETMVNLAMPALGLDWHDGFVAHDLITGEQWNWGSRNYVRLGVGGEPAHLIHVRRF
ncbi:MAG TPA: maltotransferase domain-containing protein [Ornithinimicrobium sp.]|uniref:maltotransferase domain-containing protein n=1 Tax=Ornithinimicrobium sp. TaxID=1977084 RepID=UPI002B472236|nr:maltotransferase domain-containing protein [Ornithinimicrobium sp.]HKJ12458.1 maltotransferase domain-containing protein [Ornithinimicrobium sp.]